MVLLGHFDQGGGKNSGSSRPACAAAWRQRRYAYARGQVSLCVLDDGCGMGEGVL